MVHKVADKKRFDSFIVWIYLVVGDKGPPYVDREASIDRARQLELNGFCQVASRVLADVAPAFCALRPSLSSGLRRGNPTLFRCLAQHLTETNVSTSNTDEPERLVTTGAYSQLRVGAALFRWRAAVSEAAWTSRPPVDNWSTIIVSILHVAFREKSSRPPSDILTGHQPASSRVGGSLAVQLIESRNAINFRLGSSVFSPLSLSPPLVEFIFCADAIFARLLTRRVSSSTGTAPGNTPNRERYCVPKRLERIITSHRKKKKRRETIVKLKPTHTHSRIP